MIFIETPAFTKHLKDLLDDDSYSRLQLQLAENPELGDLIEGTGGIRKLRVAAKGHGKSGGARVIYYSFVAISRIGLLWIYPKNEQDDLSSDQRIALKKVIGQWRQP
jgi:hypothetical protein